MGENILSSQHRRAFKNGYTQPVCIKTVCGILSTVSRQEKRYPQWIKRRTQMVYSCIEHIEEALEEVLEDEGPPPVMEEALNGKPCFICGRKAAYQVEAG
ncbi:MAG: CxxH/CxxC protein [Alkalicoccus sp.]|nr:MAG: CxxH/CxxC protein [Alkalicoccus sp.]